jgi:hypothetical protein
MRITPSGIIISYGGAGNGDSRPVVARIFGFPKGEEEAVSYEMVVPAGERVQQPLQQGLYNVELTLSSGRIIQRNVKISEDNYETYRFLDDFGSTDSPSLQESIGGSEADVMAKTAINLPEPEHKQAARRIPSPTSTLIDSLRKRLSFGVRKPRPRPQRELPPIVVPDAAALTLNQGWLSGLSPDVPSGEGWVERAPSEKHEKRLLWRVESYPANHPSAADRQWARIERQDGGFEIASLPLPWFCSETTAFVSADILFDLARAGGAATSVAINDAALSGLLSFLDRGQAGSARPLLEAVKGKLINDTIYSKMSNPLAACAAGYVGLAVYAPDQKERWDDWLENCMTRFPEIPDTAIVYARRLILRPTDPPDNERAAKALRQACAAGIPFFSTGVNLLREMLLQLSTDHADLLPLAEKVGQLAGRVDASQIFTVLRFAPTEKAKP